MGAELQTATLSSPFSTQTPEPLPVESQVLAQRSNDVQSPALLPVRPALPSCVPGEFLLLPQDLTHVPYFLRTP